MLLHWHQLRLKHSSLSVRVKVIRWDVRTRTLAAFTHRNPLFYFVIWAECFAFFFFFTWGPWGAELWVWATPACNWHTHREGRRERERVSQRTSVYYRPGALRKRRIVRRFLLLLLNSARFQQGWCWTKRRVSTDARTHTFRLLLELTGDHFINCLHAWQLCLVMYFFLPVL